LIEQPEYGEKKSDAAGGLIYELSGVKFFEFS
jgi:hypothetical protein